MTQEDDISLKPGPNGDTDDEVVSILAEKCWNCTTYIVTGTPQQ